MYSVYFDQRQFSSLPLRTALVVHVIDVQPQRNISLRVDFNSSNSIVVLGQRCQWRKANGQQRGNVLQQHVWL